MSAYVFVASLSHSLWHSLTFSTPPSEVKKKQNENSRIYSQMEIILMNPIADFDKKKFVNNFETNHT